MRYEERFEPGYDGPCGSDKTDLIHTPFEYQAYESIMSRIRAADDAADEAFQTNPDAPEPDYSGIPLCTCDDPGQGEGIPFSQRLSSHTQKYCRWRIAQEAEYNRIANGHLYVNVYLHDRAYGGPEEGGWWYDTYEILRVVPVKGLEDAREIACRLEGGEYSNDGRRDVSSVLSEGRYMIQIETEMGQSKPERRPHYE